jgi:aspartyl-tRNA(Asn)/glutamyl-tRNA(Gln) amidotransferase subunit B
MTWEIVIGIETHVQLQTASKIFSDASTTFGAAPNTQASVVDLALPGTLPVMNKKAVECAIKFGLAVNGGSADNIAPRSVFARKNYFYPDLPKGYQISQFELPVVTGGAVTINVEGVEKVVRLTRAHLEEDAGKSLHEGLETSGVSGIDLNRAGTPLLEVVSEPEMRSAAEAVAYAKALHGIVTWIGICDGNMQEGSFRCDANVSVRRPGEPLGTRCEIKNLNSFRFMERAIQYEVRRQIELIEDGGKVVQQTRLYDADRDETRAMRSKEDAMDYRYFPCPDLLPLVISATQIGEVNALLPELPAAMRTRFASGYDLSDYATRLLTIDLDTAHYFESAVSAGADAKLAANWINGYIAALRKQEDVPVSDLKLSPQELAEVLKRITSGELSQKGARDLVDAIRCGALLPKAGKVMAVAVAELVVEKGLSQVTDVGAIEKVVDEVLANNEKSVAEFKSGKEKALQALIGQVMKGSQGKANPAQVNEILRAKLAAL